MKKVRIKKTVFILVVLCFLGGCAERVEQKNTVKTKSQRYKGVPVELHLPSDEGIPVRIEAKEGIPVKVQLQEDNVKPVKVAIQSNEDLPLKLDIESNKSMPVKLDMEGDKGLPVEMKITRKTLILSLIPVGVSLIAAIGACIAAFGAWQSARNTKLAAEGRLFFELMREYATEEMRNDVRSLCEWGRNKGEELSEKELDKKAEQWSKALDSSKDENADKIDLSRRHLTYYFDTISRLARSKYVRKNLIKGICEGMSTRPIEIVWALGKARIKDIITGQENNKKGYKRIKRLNESLDVVKNIIDEFYKDTCG